MKVGVQVGVPDEPFPAPANLPCRLVRIGTYEWATKPYTDAGVEVLFSAATMEGWDPPPDDTAFTNYIRAVAALAVKLVEVGNEPRWSEGDIVWMKAAHRIAIAAPILRAAGKTIILAPSTSRRTKEWLTWAKEQGLFHLVDAAAVHPYAETPAKTLRIVQDARAIVPDPLPLYVTEFGVAVGDPHETGSDLAGFSPSAQDHYLRHTLNLLRGHASELGLAAAIWFCDRDYKPVEPWKLWWQTTGLRTYESRPRPAWKGLRSQASR